MRYANTDDTEHTDGRLLVNKAQGDNSVYFPPQWNLSDMSDCRSWAIGTTDLSRRHFRQHATTVDKLSFTRLLYGNDYSAFQRLDQGKYAFVSLYVILSHFLARSQNSEKTTVSFVMPVCPSAWNISVPSGRIFMKLGI
jgi:hypothetical protein